MGQITCDSCTAGYGGPQCEVRGKEREGEFKFPKGLAGEGVGRNFGMVCYKGGPVFLSGSIRARSRCCQGIIIEVDDRFS